MKKGFSLIEIVQTLVLIGIIAGISVSLFRRVDNDIKLLEATENQLEIAIDEAKRRTCADVSPICETGQLCDTSNDFKDCEQAGAICRYLNTQTGGTSTYNHASGYCEYEVANATPCLAGFNTELRNGKNLCYKEPRCVDPTKETYVEIRSSVACPNNVPLLTYRPALEGGGAGTGPYEFCYQLHSIINHKNQGGVGGASNTDLQNACTLPKGTCLLSGNCSTVNEEANMILPNGVRIYNLPCALPHPDSFCDAAHSGAIYVRYDRMDDLKMVDMNKVARYTIDAETSTINGINYITNVSLGERECFNTTTKVWVDCH